MYSIKYNKSAYCRILYLVAHRFPLERIEEAYRIFENRMDGVIKVAVTGRER